MPAQDARRGLLDCYAIHGYAIVSDDGMIATRDGAMPAALKNEADWRYFQAGLDLADLVLLGRKSHESHPDPRRPRLVASTSVESLDKRSDAWWWNPSAMPLDRVLETILPGGGRVAVPGGQGVFDLLSDACAFSYFHMARAVGVRMTNGHPIFSAIARGMTVESVLARSGMRPGPSSFIDPVAPVVLTVWQRCASDVKSLSPAHQ